MQAEDAIFNSYKASQRTRDALATSKSAPLLSIDPNVNAGNANVEKEATEVIFYGYGRDHEWAAIDFYERVSGGSILEDYDRHPPHQRYDASLSLSRAASQRSLSKAALKKRNTYNGGGHWIKVTFDSPEAADLACDRSPHTLHGYLVYAEPYRGVGPPNDAAIPCTNAGAQVDSQSLPNTFSTTTISRNQSADTPESSQTASSATAGIQDAPIPMRDLRQAIYRAPGAFSTASSSMPNLAPGSRAMTSTTSSNDALSRQSPEKQRPLRIRGATRAVLKPADQALMPAQQKYSGWLAVLVWIFASGKNEASAQIPRLPDGKVDWEHAGFYWQFFGFLDTWFGSDFCGLKGED